MPRSPLANRSVLSTSVVVTTISMGAIVTLAWDARAEEGAVDLTAVETRLSFYEGRPGVQDRALVHARDARTRSLALAAEGRAREAARLASIADAALSLADARARLARALAAHARYAPGAAVERFAAPTDVLEVALKEGAGRDAVDGYQSTEARLRAHATLLTRRAEALEGSLPQAPPQVVGDNPRALAARLADESARETFMEAATDEPRRYGSMERERRAMRERARSELLSSIPRRLATLRERHVSESELEAFEERRRALAHEADHETALVGLEDLADDLDARARAADVH